MSTCRPYRLIHGVAYPHLIEGEHETQYIESSLKDPDDFYYDHAVRLSDADISRFNHLQGKPICVEHDHEIEVGEIVKAYPDHEGKLRVDAKIFTDTELGTEVWSFVERGLLRGLSVGYDAQIVATDYGLKRVEDKSFHEVSLCYKPFFEGSYISVCASKNSKKKKQNKINQQKYNTKPAKTLLLFKIMASNPNQEQAMEKSPQPPAPKPTPKEVENSSPPSQKPLVSEMEKVEHNMLIQLQQSRDEKKAMADELARLKKEKEERDAQLNELEQLRKEKAERKARENAAKLEKFNTEYKPWIIEQHKAANGDDAELPESYLKSLISAVTDDDPHQQTNLTAVCASAMAFKKLKEQNDKIAKERAELEQKLQVYKEGDARGAAHINASFQQQQRRGIQNYKKRDTPDTETKEVIDVAASKKKQIKLFKLPTPNPKEAHWAQRSYPNRDYSQEFMANPTLKVNASAGVANENQTTFEKLYERTPTSQYEDGPSMANTHPHVAQHFYKLFNTSGVPDADLRQPIIRGRRPIGNFFDTTERF